MENSEHKTAIPPEVLLKFRQEFYRTLEEKEPFGNEYHDELFAWMIVKIESYSAQQVAEATKLCEKLNVRLNEEKADTNKWYKKYNEMSDIAVKHSNTIIDLQDELEKFRKPYSKRDVMRNQIIDLQNKNFRLEQEVEELKKGLKQIVASAESTQRYALENEVELYGIQDLKSIAKSLLSDKA